MKACAPMCTIYLHQLLRTAKIFPSQLHDVLHERNESLLDQQLVRKILDVYYPPRVFSEERGALGAGLSKTAVGQAH